MAKGRNSAGISGEYHLGYIPASWSPFSWFFSFLQKRFTKQKKIWSDLNCQLVLSSKTIFSSLSLSLSAISCGESKCKMSAVIERQRFELESWNWMRLNCHQACVLLHTCHSPGLWKRNLPGHTHSQSLKGSIFSISTVSFWQMKPLLNPVIRRLIWCPCLYKLGWNIAGWSLSFGEH